MLGRRFTSSRVRKERKKRFIMSATLWLALAVALLFLVIELAHLKHLRIMRVRFEGNVAVSDEALWETLKPHLDGAHLHLFSKRNTFFVPYEEMEGALMERFVRLKDVDVRRDGFHTLVVESIERRSDGIWCPPQGAAAQTDDAAVVTSCYYTDAEGLAFGEAPHLSGGTFLIYERAFPEEPLGARLTSPEHLRSLSAFIGSLMPFDIRIERVVWESDALILRARAVSASERVDRFSIKVPLSPPYEQAYSNLVSVLEAPGDDGEKLSLFGIDYIDVRFENKVFYKKSETSLPEG